MGGGMGENCQGQDKSNPTPFNRRRANTQGGTYFFTVNTYRRQPILTDTVVRQALREGIAKTRYVMQGHYRADWCGDFEEG